MKSFKWLLFCMSLSIHLQAANLAYYKIPIDGVGAETLKTLKSRDSFRLWVEGGKTLLVLSTTLPNLDAKKLKLSPNPQALRRAPFDPHTIHDIQKKHHVLLISGRQVVYQLSPGHLESPGNTPITDNLVLARLASNEESTAMKSQLAPELFNSLWQQIDMKEWLQQVEALSSFNRYTYHPQAPDVHQYIRTQWNKISGLELEEQNFQTPKGPSKNFIATIKGKTNPEQVYIIGAHYDSTSEAPMKSAPGAEDNASGTAALLSLAKAIVSNPPDATLVLVSFGAEEQGLLGSRHYVNHLKETNKLSKVKKTLVMDMIGFSKDEELDCLIESSIKQKPLVDELFALANQFSQLKMYRTYNYWGSDHVPFIQEGIQAALLIENDYMNYPAYHSSSDRVENIKLTQAAEVVKLITAAAASWVYTSATNS